MNPELRRLETEIFYDRKLRRIEAIREAWAAYMKTLEKPKKNWLLDLLTIKRKGG